MKRYSIILLALIILGAGILSSCASSNIHAESLKLPDDMSRLSILAREHGYSNFESMVIINQADLDSFVADVNEQDHWNNKAKFLNDLTSWQIDFSTHNLILYRNTETSGGTVVTLGEPLVENSAVTISVHRGPLGATDDMAYYCYAYKVSKLATSVTFVVEGKDDVFFGLSEETIISEGPSLTTTIEDIECEIDVYLWRDFMPIIPPGGSPLTGVITIRPLNTTSIPDTWVIDDEVTITHDDGTWITEYAEKRFEPSYWEFVVRGGPQWETETTTTVILELSVTYLTFAPAEDFSKTYTLVFNNVPIEATY
jgi:hypothetical protein